MSGTSTPATPAPRTGGRDGPVPPARRGSASAAIVLCVFALVVLTRWHPFLLGGPSVLLLATVAATLSPPRRRRRAARRARTARSGVPYSSVRQWDAARQSLAQLPEAEIPPEGGPPTRPTGRPESFFARAGLNPGGPYDVDYDRSGLEDRAGFDRGESYRADPYGANPADPVNPADVGRYEARRDHEDGIEPDPASEPLAVGHWSGGEGSLGDPEADGSVAADGERPRRRGRRPWSGTGDRPLVRVLDPVDGSAGDPEQTMAIDMRPLLGENDLIEQTMAIDIRGFLHDPGYGRG
ncbi:MAG: hypothetical protein ACQSGP_01765 [Frankia sp.]